MKIVVVNPNTSLEATRFISAEAARAASAGTEVTAATAPRGPLHIGSVAESTAQGPVVLEVVERLAPEVDGAIVAAYSDPGLGLVRARLSLPAVGIGESSMKEAARRGDRIVIVSSNPNNEPLYRERAAHAGLADKLVSIRYLPKAERPVLDVLADREWLISAAIEASRKAARDDGADAVIIAGGPLAGVAREVAGSVPIPVLDCVACAVKRIERWVSTGAPD